MFKDHSPYTDVEGLELEPGLSCYSSDSQYATSAKVRSAQTCRPSWNEMEFFLEVKKEKADAFSEDPAARLENPSDKGSHSRGQITAYAATMASRQHRNFFFSVFVAGNFVRFMRWDRSGCIVTRRSNYHEKPAVFAEFLWRYEHLSQAGRGYDPTATRATLAERARLQLALTAHPSIHKSSLDDLWPVYKLQVNRRVFIVNKPVSTAESPIGRATRGYVALDTETGKLAFLKDTWRVVGPLMIPESDIYAFLLKNKVPHIATFICGGDVLWPLLPEPQNEFSPPAAVLSSCISQQPNDHVVEARPNVLNITSIFPAEPHENAQATISHEYADSTRYQWLRMTGLNPFFRRHVHFRMAQDFIGKSLDDFENSEELVRALYHALLGTLFIVCIVYFILIPPL